MATTEAVSAQGTYISTGNGASPETWTELAEVVNIGGPEESADELDATHLRSPGAYKEFIPSFKDGGEIPLEMNFIPSNATQQAIRTEFQTNPPPTKHRKITFPDGSTCEFSAWMKSIGSPAQVGNILRLNASIRIVGPTDWTFAP